MYYCSQLKSQFHILLFGCKNDIEKQIIELEELSQLNSDFQENLQGLDVVQMFRRETFNSKVFILASLTKGQNGTIFYDSSISAFIEWISLAAVSMVLAIGGFSYLWEYRVGNLNDLYSIFSKTF